MIFLRQIKEESARPSPSQGSSSIRPAGAAAPPIGAARSERGGGELPPAAPPHGADPRRGGDEAHQVDDQGDRQEGRRPGGYVENSHS